MQQRPLIRSDRGNRDLPVALLAQGLRGLRMKDIGGGGFEGFADLNTPPAIQWPFFKGGHAAPLETAERRAGIASYVTTGAADQPNDLIDNAGAALAVLSRFSPVLILLVATLVAASIAWVILVPGVPSITAVAVLAAAFVLLTVL